MPSLREIIEEDSTRAGRAFDLSIQGLIFYSLATFAFETMPDLSSRTRGFLEVSEAVVVGVFTLEYLLRLLLADSRPRFVFSFFGVVDLLAILPFYLATGVDLRSLRALRFLRLFQVLKLARYNAAIRRFHRAFVIVREELALFGMVTAILLFLAATGIYYFEHDVQPQKYASVPHSLWWAVCTLTTVGYGDVYPVTPGGKVFTLFILMLGLGVVSVPAGLVASALSKARELEDGLARRGSREPESVDDESLRGGL